MSVAVASETLALAPAADWVIASAAPGGSESVSGADLDLLMEDRQLHFSKQGDDMYVDSIARINTPQGLGALGTITLQWNPDTMSVTVHKLHITRGLQVIDVLANQSFTVLRRERNLEYAVVDGVLTAAIQPLGLQVGDVVELAYTLRRSDPVLAGTSEWLVGGWPTLPIRRMHVRATWNPATTMHWQASKALARMREQRSADRIVASIDLENVQPLVQPKLAPARFAQLREVEFSGFRSWLEVASLLTPLYEHAAVLPDVSTLHAEIERIRASSADAVGRAEAALSLVQDQVRYVYLGLNDGGLVPADADVTWTRRFGDCKAKTALLLAVLHGLGIDAEPVIVSTTRGDGLDSKLPMLSWFDHVIVRARISDRDIWLDGTRSGDRRISNVPDFPFHWGLPLKPGSSALVPIPLRPLPKPTVDLTLRIDASAGVDVAAPAHAELKVSGDAALVINRALVNASSSDVETRLKKYWKGQYDFVDISSIGSSFDESTATETWIMDGTARMDWSSDSYEADGLGLGYKADLERQAGPDDDAPYLVAFPAFSRTSETILLPKGGTGFRIEGKDVNVTIAGVEYRRSSTLKDGKFTGEASTRTLAPEFPHADAAAAQKALRDLSKQQLRILAPTATDRANGDQPAKSSGARATANEHAYKGSHYLEEGKTEPAIEEFNAALELDPQNDKALAERGVAEIYQHKLDLARRDLAAAFALNPRSPAVYRGRGMLSLQEHHPQEAVEAFSESLTLQPMSTFTLGFRAAAYAELRETDKALADCHSASRIDPKLIGAYGFCANLYAGENKRDLAIAEADAMIAANPDSAEAFYAAGKIYDWAHESGRAVAALDKAVQLEPGAKMLLARSEVRPRGNLTERRKDVEAALKYEPRSEDALIELAQIQYESGEYANTITTLNTMMTLPDADKPYLFAGRAVAYEKSGQLKLARQDIAAARLAARDGKDYNEICWALATGNMELRTALEMCDQALAKSSGQAVYADSRGFVLLRLGRYDEAITQYDQALGWDPRQAESLFGRGVAKLRKGELEAGSADIKAADLIDAHVIEEFAAYGVRP